MEENKTTGFMPMSLTAEDGAKLLLIGEFFETVYMNDPETGEDYIHKVPVSWSTIKDIYDKIVTHYQGEISLEEK